MFPTVPLLWGLESGARKVALSLAPHLQKLTLTFSVHFFGEMEQEEFCSPGGCGWCGHQGVGGL